MPRRDSESDDSYRSRSRRKKSKKKSRKSSSSSPSTSRSSSSEKSKPRQYRRSHSGDRGKRHHKSSHSKRRHRKSHSSSSSDSRSRSKKHSSRVKERSRRSLSRSHSRSRSSKISKRSRSPSPKKNRSKEQVHKKDREIEGNSKRVSEEDILREKLEAALKAAAIADAQLRQKGLLADSTQKNADAELNINQQLKRAQAIEEINSGSFVQQEFLSSRNWGNKSSKVTSETTSTVDVTEISVNDSSATNDDWRTNAEKLVHPSWFEDTDIKMDRWKKKLSELRSRKYNEASVV